MLLNFVVLQKPMMYGIMVGGWTLGLYFTQMLLDNIQVILVTYQAYVFWYIVTTGFISFVICYRMGPPKNQRSKDLIKWGLQLAANIMIFYSSHFREASVGVMIVVLGWTYFPIRWLSFVRGFWWALLIFCSCLMCWKSNIDEENKKTREPSCDLYIKI